MKNRYKFICSKRIWMRKNKEIIAVGIFGGPLREASFYKSLDLTYANSFNDSTEGDGSCVISSYFSDKKFLYRKKFDKSKAHSPLNHYIYDLTLNTVTELKHDYNVYRFFGNEDLLACGIIREKGFVILNTKTNKEIYSWPHRGLPVGILRYNDRVVYHESMKKKYCFNLKTGKEEWGISKDSFPEFKEFKNLGWNFKVGDLVIGHDEYKGQPHERDRGIRTWFGIDVKTGNLVWCERYDNSKLNRYICPRGYHHSIFLSEKDEEFYFRIIDFNTGKLVTRIKITEQLESIEENECDLYGNDPFIRAIYVEGDDVYFGLGRHYLHMDIMTLEIEILYTGKSVFDGLHYIKGRLFVGEMIGGLLMFRKDSTTETDLDRLFIEEKV